jgi:hypothetical protein
MIDIDEQLPVSLGYFGYPRDELIPAACFEALKGVTKRFCSSVTQAQPIRLNANISIGKSHIHQTAKTAKLTRLERVHFLFDAMLERISAQKPQLFTISIKEIWVLFHLVKDNHSQKINDVLAPFSNHSNDKPTAKRICSHDCKSHNIHRRLHLSCSGSIDCPR